MQAAYTSWTWIKSKDRNQAVQELENSFKELKFLGYDYIENFAFIADFFPDPEELVALTKKYNVNLCNLYGHFGFDAEAEIAKAEKQIDFIEAIGGKYFNCQNGGFGDDGPSERPTNPEMLDKMAYIADTVGAYAVKKGIKLCFHPHYGTCVFSASDIDYLAAHTNPEYTFFCIDTAHTTLAGINPAELVKKLGSRVQYMHLKDVDTFDLKTAEGRDKMATFRALGHGTVDFKEVKAALEEIGYDGILCVELDRPEIGNFHSAEVSRIFMKDVLGV